MEMWNNIISFESSIDFGIFGMLNIDRKGGRRG